MTETFRETAEFDGGPLDMATLPEEGLVELTVVHEGYAHRYEYDHDATVEHHRTCDPEDQDDTAGRARVRFTLAESMPFRRFVDHGFEDALEDPREEQDA